MKSLALTKALLLLHIVLVSGAPFIAKRYRKTQMEDQNYWNNLAQNELKRALGVEKNTNVAKNVILFLGDGMSIPTLTAARIYKGQQKNRGGEEGHLTFEAFHHMGLSKTYNVDKQVPDSAGTGTAYLTGVKTNYKTIGFDASIKYDDCQTMYENNKVYSIAKWAQDAGKRSGVVTSTRVTHATPASTYAHVANRDWECDGAIKAEDMQKCPELKDIARQLIEDEPGSSLNVIMGGGYQNFDANAVDRPNDPLDNQWASCKRKDGRDLVKSWLQKKHESGVKHQFVRTRTELNDVDTSDIEYLFALFSNGHMPYEHEKKSLGLDVPTLAEMTEKAIEILSSQDNGFFLLVEGGRIDHAHHDTLAHRALDEAVAMDEAIEKALNLTSEEDTLIVVTADHAHTMSISGYPSRGQEIIGLAALGDDGLPYTTLMYANGPGYNYTTIKDESEGGYLVSRWNISQEVATGWDYTQLAAVPRNSETHGGDDVAIYANGPMAHLFHTLHEQNYIAHAMAYAACIGANQDHCKSTTKTTAGQYTETTAGLYTETTTAGGSTTAALPGVVLALLSALWLRH
ncbi:alkaline phosphatase-like [Penaeus chinensis]|uniref:alkaline phosphatase-like n=1 Tax=Penaeus chinensis TaxID=139456 RepID=UPI001FB5A343|nr:alkaline phosphatase-like [Penaeus chinensis]